MNPHWRHIRRRVAGVGVATGLLLLVLAPPAFAATPTITSFLPTSGPVGCGITITGTNFNNGNVTAVDVNGTAAASFNIVSGTQLTAVVGGGTTTGPIHVTNPSGTATSATNYTVVAAPGGCSPSISSFGPSSGPVGTTVTITGSNFLGATNVDFNGTAAPFVVVSSTQVSALVPSGATTGAIHVTTGVAPTAASSSSFTVTAAAPPTISTFAPTSGPVGTIVTITGTSFTGATLVTFNNVSAVFSVASATSITATVPTGATTGAIRVSNPSGTATSSTNFTVTTAPLPTITSFTPTAGHAGTIVTITGTNFSGTGFTTTSVTFNNVTATFSVISATTISATVPATATTGPIRVTNPGGTATSATNFTVVSAPTITSFTPTSGRVGTIVTITGTNFSGTGFTTTSVTFNNVNAPTFLVTSATSITATVPTGAGTGPIRVTTPGGTATGAANFTVRHARSVGLRLSGSLTTSGRVGVADGFGACASRVPVKVQRLVAGIWKTIKSVTTNGSGAYTASLSDVAGKYRALAPKVTLSSGNVCQRAVSPIRTHA